MLLVFFFLQNLKNIIQLFFCQFLWSVSDCVWM